MYRIDSLDKNSVVRAVVHDRDGHVPALGGDLDVVRRAVVPALVQLLLALLAAHLLKVVVADGLDEVDRLVGAAGVEGRRVGARDQFGEVLSVELEQVCGVIPVDKEVGVRREVVLRAREQA